MAAKKETPGKTIAYEPTFTYEQIMGSKRFKPDIDIVYAVLDHGKEYTIAEVESKIKAFKNGKVG